MYTLNGWWFLSSAGSYPPGFMVDRSLETLGVELTPPGYHSLGSTWLNPKLGLFRVAPPKSHLPHVT